MSLERIEARERAEPTPSPRERELEEALRRMRFLLAEVEEGVPAICDTPLFASREFAADFKRVVEFALSKPLPLSEPSNAQAGQGWRPIESAPRDGTHVLVYWPRMVIGPEGEITDEVLPEPGHVSVSSNLLGGWEPDSEVESPGVWDDDFEYGAPTHWMPLPSPPTPLSGEEQGT